MHRLLLAWLEQPRVQMAVGFTVLGVIVETVVAIATQSLIVPVLLLVLAGVMVPIVRTVRKSNEVKRAKIAAAQGRTQWPSRVGRRLLNEEVVRWEERQHPLAIFNWWVMLGVGFVISIFLAGVLNGVTHDAFVAAMGFLAVMAITSLVVGWNILEWWFDIRVITDRRIIIVSGILTTTTATIPIARLLNVSTKEPLLAKIVAGLGFPGYNHLRFDTAAQEEPFRELRFVVGYREANELLQTGSLPRRGETML